MPTCPKCNSEQSDTAQFCSQCAQPLALQVQPPARSKTSPLTIILTLVGIGLAIFISIHLVRAIDQQAPPKATFATTPAPAPETPPPPPPPLPHTIPIVNSAATVNASSYAWYTFTVPEGATVPILTGHFTATGGGGNDLICYVIDEDGLVNFKNGHPVRTYYNSGKLTTATIRAVLPGAGTYYLVFDNRYSLITPKAAQVLANLTYIQ